MTIENPLQLVFDETLYCLMDILKVKKTDFDFNNYQWDKASAIYGIPFLDVENKDEILRLLKIMNREGKTIIIVTHDLSLLDISDRNIHID